MIYTFYSYKGGVGRTMALANIAELMYRAGLQVIIIDWDLEAPGLERFFPSLDLNIVEHSPGVIDMLLHYKRQAASVNFNQPEDVFFLDDLDLNEYLIDVYPEQSEQGKLYLLPAGYRGGAYLEAYTQKVLNFDWGNFYQNWAGGSYFEWLRTELNTKADVILIDSRTGITEMGGVCTYHLADVVVLLCAPNSQNVQGTYQMLQALSEETNPILKEARGEKRKLLTLVVPSRVDITAQLELTNDFWDEYNKFFLDHIPPQLSPNKEFFSEVKIPYIPLYAFEELVAVRESSSKYAPELVEAYVNIRDCLAKLSSPKIKNKIIKVGASISRKQNPFQYGGPISPEKFVGHQKAAEACLNLIVDARQNNISVTGERRIGKTSLLYYLQTNAQTEDWGQHLPIFLDWGIFDRNIGSNDFWYELLDLLQSEMEPLNPDLNQYILNLLEKPSLKHSDFQRFLRRFHRTYPNKQIILLLDEFELAFEDMSLALQDILKNLRALTLSRDANFTLVTATRDPLSEVSEPFKTQTGLEFHSNFVTIPLANFDHSETKQAVGTLLAETIIHFTEEETNQIWQISQGPDQGARPIYVQLAASILFEHKQRSREPLSEEGLETEFRKRVQLY